MMPTASVSCLIIGGGIAGISVARCLLGAGFDDVKILEATDRIGGRIKTVDIDPYSSKSIDKAELGATYIHGIESNPIYQIAQENNLLKLTQRELKNASILAVTEDGEEVNTKVVQEVDWHYGMLMQDCEEFYLRHKPTPVENDSVGDHMKREMDRYLERYEGQDRHIREMLFQQRLLHEACLCGSDEAMADVSLGEIGSYEELPGSNYLIHDGFESVIEALAQTIPSSSLFLNHKVRKIHWDQQADTHVLVHCDNGHVFTADHVIVTASLGYLKSEHSVLFEPSLPYQKIGAIEHLGYGCVDKFVIQFEEELFDGKYRRVDLIWNRDEDDADMFNIKENWHRLIHSIEFITPNTIQGWLTGSTALHLESLTDAEILQKVVSTLEKFIKQSLPKAKRLIRSRWASDKFSKGSYTYIPVGATTMDIENLMEPLPLHSPQPHLLFAGEATHPVFYSTTHGAMLTGEREAQRIIDMYVHREHNNAECDSDDSDAIMF